MKPICVCWKTSRNAKASPTRGGGIERSEDDGEVVQSSTCVIPLTLKASFVQPLRRLRRQLSWQESPWQRGVVFDETDLRLLKNITECQSLSQRERLWHSAKSAITARGSLWISWREDDGEVSSPQKQIPHTGRLRCGGAGMESENVFKRFCHRRRRCGSCHRRCRCTAPGRGRCAPRPPHRWGRGLQWQKPCSGSRCRPCR